MVIENLELEKCTDSNIFKESEIKTYILEKYLCPKKLNINIDANEIANVYSTLEFVVNKCDPTGKGDSYCEPDDEINDMIDNSFVNIAFRNKVFGYENPKHNPVRGFIDNSKQIKLSRNTCSGIKLFLEYNYVSVQHNIFLTWKRNDTHFV
jgi:hypothetical protein